MKVPTDLVLIIYTIGVITGIFICVGIYRIFEYENKEDE